MHTGRNESCTSSRRRFIREDEDPAHATICLDRSLSTWYSRRVPSGVHCSSSGPLPASRPRRVRGCRHQRAHGEGVRCLTNGLRSAGRSRKESTTRFSLRATIAAPGRCITVEQRSVAAGDPHPARVEVRYGEGTRHGHLSGHRSRWRETWYSTAFQQKPYLDEPFYVGFNIAGYELGLDPNPNPTVSRPGSGGGVAYWRVADVDAAVAHFVTAGAIVAAPVLKRGWRYQGRHGDGSVWQYDRPDRKPAF